MGINATSYVANVANHLQQLREIRQQQVQIDLQVGETARRARQQSVDQSMQDLTKQAERVTEIKQAALHAHQGSIDVWA